MITDVWGNGGNRSRTLRGGEERRREGSEEGGEEEEGECEKEGREG